VSSSEYERTQELPKCALPFDKDEQEDTVDNADSHDYLMFQILDASIFDVFAYSEG